MARKKEYIEEEVIEKAMNLFWKNGYETTSMQMLEKEMGINKFSIYASFGNKNGVLLESIKCYKKKLNRLILKLESSTKGVNAIKDYFYDFVEFTKEIEFGKGCLVTNTANELTEKADEQIKKVLENFTNEIKEHFMKVLKKDATKDEITVKEQGDFLIIAMFGLASATRVFNPSQLKNYIENTFKSL
ncbi:TetR/AcrR family transcriptional regulator [Wenyingzhuangia sp. IMCC45467]